MQVYQNEQEIVDKVIEKVGKKIVLGTPLAAGKANHIVNAFYQKAVADPSIHLTIATGLTLQKPAGSSDLEKRFLEPFAKRVFGDYPDLDYEIARLSDKLPANIRVIEFYYPAGKYLKNNAAQQNYISTNYTHVVRDMLDRKINVIAQLVAQQTIGDVTFFSLSCNPDVTADIIESLKDADYPVATIAQVNQNLPFMFGDAQVPHNYFDFVFDDPSKYYKIFSTPKMSVGDADFMIGLYSSTLIKDDGELQIGIGSLGDSTVYSMLLRQQENELYQQILKDCKVQEKFGKEIEALGDTKPFERGLFGATELLVDGFMHLYKAGIIKRKVYDHIGLQRLLNADLITEEFKDNILEILLQHKVIHSRISKVDFDFLQYWGIFKPKLRYQDGQIKTEDDRLIEAFIGDPESLAQMKAFCLGTTLLNGQIMHAGFFLGPEDFYQWLRDMPDEEKKLINMKSVQKINQLYGHEILDRLHRKNARFINSCMMYTLSGAAVSDGLANGKVVSGVGGQYNFVAMAQELPDGNSILNLRSTKSSNGKLRSNIIPNYGHITIPRHLRDVVITEYGIAYIRGMTDEEIIKALLNITDSRFQQELLKWAKSVGKIKAEYEIPKAFRNNLPSSYEPIIKRYKAKGYFPTFPFGTDFTEEEIILGKALKSLKADLSKKFKLLKTLVRGWWMTPQEKEKTVLGRMGLQSPVNFKEKIYQKLLLAKLRETM